MRWTMENKPVLIGWGVGSITPSAPVLLRGQTYLRTSEGVHDPLLATCMAIGHGKADAVLWLSLDLTQLPQYVTERIAAAVAEKIEGFTRDRLICSCIHTHTAPYLDRDRNSELWGEFYRIRTVPEGVMPPEDYRDKVFIPGCVDACVKALEAMAPAGVSAVLGHAVIGHCRRVVYRDGTSKMYGSANTYNFERSEGPSDDSIEYIYVYDGKGRLTGLVMNVCCPAQVVESQCVVSADFVGAFRRQLAETLGYELPVLTIIGAAGDISPRDLIRQRPGRDPFNPKQEMGPNGKPLPWNRGEASMRSFEGTEELGRRLVWSFLYDREKADAAVTFDFPFAYRFEYLPTRIRTVSEDEYAAANARLKAALEEKGGDYSAFSDEEKRTYSLDAAVVNRYARQKKSVFYQTPLHIMRIGDCALYTCPYELFLEYGQRIRARSNATHTLIAELTDDETEYLPTPFAVAAKSYSALVCNQLVSCEGGEFFVESVIERINRLFSENAQ